MEDELIQPAGIDLLDRLREPGPPGPFTSTEKKEEMANALKKGMTDPASTPASPFDLEGQSLSFQLLVESISLILARYPRTSTPRPDNIQLEGPA